MKLSQFVYIVNGMSERGNSIMFNTLTKDILALPTEILHSILEGAAIPEKLKDFLKMRGILKEEDRDEMRDFEYWYNCAKFSRPYLLFTIIPSYNCNCKCVYCYADGITEDVSMSPKICKDVLKWIDHQVEFYKPTGLIVGFHGGEPMTDFATVRKIAKGIKEICNSRGIERSPYTMVTNGTLLSPGSIKTLLNLDIQRVMVTIDGPPHIHNLRRPYKSGKGTFHDILNNVKYALDHDMEVVLGPNIDKQNVETMPELLDILVREGVNKKANCLFFSGLVMHGSTPDNPSYFKRYNYTSEKEMANDLASTYKEACVRGFLAVDPIGFGFCSFKKASHHIIDPYGRLYRCITNVGREDNLEGTIYDNDELVTQELAQLLNIDVWRKNEKCMHCCFLPLCLGGCGQTAVMEHGSREHTMCLEPFLKEYLPLILPIAYKRYKAFPELYKRKKEVISELFAHF